MGEPDKQIPLKNAVPFIEYATIEEDDNIQDMWANLLVNGTHESRSTEINRSFIEILSQISSTEAQILREIYKLDFSLAQKYGIVTTGLPFHADLKEANYHHDEINEPFKDIILALANLQRLGCLTFDKTMKGKEIFSIIRPTLLGRELVYACTI